MRIRTLSLPFLLLLIATIVRCGGNTSLTSTAIMETPNHQPTNTIIPSETTIHPTVTMLHPSSTVEIPEPTDILVQTPNLTPSTSGVSFVDSGQRLGNTPSGCVDLGDLDGDGDLDAIVADERYSQIWLNYGSGTFIEGQRLTKNVSGLRLGDLDLDKDLDLFVVDIDGSAVVWLNDGEGTFTADQRISSEANGNDIALGDVDSDGDLDAYIARNGLNTLWLNDGHGKFQDSGQRFGTGHPVNDLSIGAILADLDNDGDLDVFEIIYGGLHRVWFNDATGTYIDSGQEIDVGSGHSHGAALGDLDGDGDLDAFITITEDLAFQVWFNDGYGYFNDSGQQLPSTSAQRVDLGDLDGDEDLDAFMAHTGISDSGAGNTIWLNDGSGRFEDSGLRLGHSYSLDVALGDLDGDSDLDAFVTNSFFSHSTVDKSNRVWLNVGFVR